MAGEKPANGADDGWSAHKLPASMDHESDLVCLNAYAQATQASHLNPNSVLSNNAPATAIIERQLLGQHKLPLSFIPSVSKFNNPCAESDLMWYTHSFSLGNFFFVRLLSHVTYLFKLLGHFHQAVLFQTLQVDPYESREDPAVCAALIGANTYIDLDDVMDAEIKFWKVRRITTCHNGVPTGGRGGGGGGGSCVPLFASRTHPKALEVSEAVSHRVRIVIFYIHPHTIIRIPGYNLWTDFWYCPFFE